MAHSRTPRLRRRPSAQTPLRIWLTAGLTAAISMIASPSAQAAVACGPAEGFSRSSGGALHRLTDASPLVTENSMAEAGQVGRGWGSFAWSGSGGDGVVYALTTDGRLLWYRWIGSGWAPRSSSVIGVGFTPGTRLTNIAVGANGWIYTVRSDARLVAYQHLGRLTGTASWGNGGGVTLGRGWTADEIIAPQGDGVVYRQWNGNLLWYRHSDPTAGPVVWNNAGRGIKVGAGWRFYDLLPLGAGVLLATSAPSGQVTVWQHADPVSGGPGWLVTGRKKFVARAESFGVSFAPDTCR
jgi:hypothetical protein